MFLIKQETQNKLQEILWTNCFPLTNSPLIVVVRHLNFLTGKYIKDTGMNYTDTVFLLNTNRREGYYLTGRSYANIIYIQKMLKGELRCNYIASQYKEKGLTPGLHRGYPALVQHAKLIINRTHDEELFDDDDYAEYDIVADNFHAGGDFTAASAGCIVVKGKAIKNEDNTYKMTGEWAIAHDWIYEDNKDQLYFDECILEYNDYARTSKILRAGSTGIEVQKLQDAFNKYFGEELKITLKVDGDFGFNTHLAIRKLEILNKKFPTGLADLFIQKLLKLV